MTKYTIKQTQAVWETCLWEVEVPDDIPEDEKRDYAFDEVGEGKAALVAGSVQVGDAVMSLDPEYEVVEAADPPVVVHGSQAWADAMHRRP